MPFLQAVFCLKGFDNRSRFFATSLITLLSFIFFSAVFSAYLVVNIIILLLLTAVLSLSTKRRLHDAKLNKNWQMVPGALFLLTGGLSSFIENSSSYYLLLLPALSTALLLTYPSKNGKTQRKYTLGYSGPVDLSHYQQSDSVVKAHNQRIEPTLVADGISEQLYVSESDTEQSLTPKSQTENKQVDIGELIRLKLLSNRKFQLGVLASITIILLAVLINSFFSSTPEQDDNVKTEVTEPKLATNEKSHNVFTNKDHLLAMPDNFYLYQSPYQGIIIHWQADHLSNGELWSQTTAKGDESCQSLQFNKGAPLRPLTVTVENSSDYYASFSPLDSRALIQALAFRGKFSLCGYNFSLKGTQAVLGKHAKYAPFLEQKA
ncbi:MAG: hypothetical protein GY928_06305 [Colwellia sp.]|nr:hypothetical protein [Colwellia sp.]